MAISLHGPSTLYMVDLQFRFDHHMKSARVKINTWQIFINKQLIDKRTSQLFIESNLQKLADMTVVNEK